MNLTAQEIDVVCDRIAEHVLARLGLAAAKSAGSAPVFLHSLSPKDFAVCVDSHPEVVCRKIRMHSKKMPREFVKGPPYHINGPRVLPLWGVTLELASARLAAARAQTQSRSARTSLE